MDRISRMAERVASEAVDEYRRARREADGLVRRLEGEFRRFDRKQERDPSDWSYAAAMLEVVETLRNLEAVLKGAR